MAKHWKNKKNKIDISILYTKEKDQKIFNKINKMENIQNEELQKKFLEKRDPSAEPEQDPETFTVREYKLRFNEVKAYRLAEDSKIHCADTKTLEGRAGDYYVCLDRVQELVLTPEIFKKMFIIKLEN